MKERLTAFFNSRAVYPFVALVAAVMVFGIGPWIANRPRPSPPLNLSLVTSAGTPSSERWSLASQRGKVVLLDFWATWCGPCQRSAPTLRSLQDRYRARGLVVVGVNTDEDGPMLVPAFMRRFQLSHTMLTDDGSASRAFQIRALPTTILIDRQGMIRRVATGDEPESELAAQIEKYL